MARDLNGYYEAPSGTDAIPGGYITDAQWDNFTADIGAEMTGSARESELRDLGGSNLTSGSASAYALTLATPWTQINDGLPFSFRVHLANAGPCTLALNNGKAFPVRFLSGQDLVANNLVPGGLYTASYGATSFSSSITGTLTNNSSQVTAVSSTTGLVAGQFVSSAVPGIAPGTTIASVSGTTVTLSAPYTGLTTVGAAVLVSGGEILLFNGALASSLVPAAGAAQVSAVAGMVSVTLTANTTIDGTYKGNYITLGNAGGFNTITFGRPSALGAGWYCYMVNSAGVDIQLKASVLATFTGTLTNGTRTITNVSSTAGLAVGQTLYDPNNLGFGNTLFSWPTITNISGTTVTFASNGPWTGTTGTYTICAVGERIDAQPTYYFYHTEVRLFTCDGTNITSTLLSGGYKVFGASTNWFAPPGLKQLHLIVIGGGGGGGGGGANGAGGGGGGAYFEAFIPAENVSGYIPIYVGAGGSGGAPGVSGQVGGVSYVGFLAGQYYAAMGGAGGAGSSTGQNGGGGGGIGYGTTMLAGSPNGGPPDGPANNTANTLTAAGNVAGSTGGGGGVGSGINGGCAERGGGGGGAGGSGGTTNGTNAGTSIGAGLGGASMYGAGGGGGGVGSGATVNLLGGWGGLGGIGGYFTGAGTAGALGTPTAGSNRGNWTGADGGGGGGTAYPAPATGANGGAAGFPGGGGGGAGYGTTTSGTGGAGGRGQVYIRWW